MRRRVVGMVLGAAVVVGAATKPAAAATLAFEKTWGGISSESAEGTAVAGDGSVYVTGWTFSFGAGDQDIFLLKYGPDGVLLWQRTWRHSGPFVSDAATDVAVGADGSVYVTGTTLGQGTDVLLLKFSPEGDLLWQRTWGGAVSDTGDALVVASDGSIYVAGGTESFGGGGTDALLLKFAPDGSLVWQKTWGAADFEKAQGLTLGPDGNVYVTGTASRTEIPFNHDAFLLKFAPDGSLLAETAWSAGDTADATTVAVAPDGSIYIGGALHSPAHGSIELDAFLVKLTADLTLEWQRTWGGRSGDRANAVTVAPDETVYLAGDTNSFGAGSDDAFLLQISPAGRVLEANTWGGSGIEHANDVDLATDGSIYVGGVAEQPPYQFLETRRRTSRVKGALTTPGGILADAAGTVATPGGIVGTPEGSETFAGATDSALLKILP